MADETTQTQTESVGGAAGTASPGSTAISTPGEGGAAPAGEGKASPPAMAGAESAAPPTDPKPDAEPKADAKEGEGEAKADDKAADAPVDYAALKMPEGYKADDPVFAEAVKLFGDNKIAPETAQKLLDFTVERDKSIVKAVNDANAENWTKQTDAWKAESEKKFSAEELGGARKVAEQVFDKDTLAYLEGMKFFNHPGLVGALVKISKAISDDTFVPGNAAVNGARDARSQYPNSNMNP